MTQAEVNVVSVDGLPLHEWFRRQDLRALRAYGLNRAGLKDAQIGERLGCSQGTAWQLVWQGKKIMERNRCARHKAILDRHAEAVEAIKRQIERLVDGPGFRTFLEDYDFIEPCED